MKSLRSEIDWPYKCLRKLVWGHTNFHRELYRSSCGMFRLSINYCHRDFVYTANKVFAVLVSLSCVKRYSKKNMDSDISMP